MYSCGPTRDCTAEELCGYATSDAGATKSMSGTALLASCQKDLASLYGHRPARTTRAMTRSTHANGQGESLGQLGIPHELGLPADGRCICFTAAPTPSPLLPGLHWLHAAGAHVDSRGSLVDICYIESLHYTGTHGEGEARAVFRTHFL